MYDIKEINVLRNEGKINIVAKNESLPGAVEKIFKINIPPRMDRQNFEI